MSEVITLKPHRYGGARKVGDRYSVSGQDERLVRALGWVADAPPIRAAAAPVPVVTAPSAQPATTSEPQQPDETKQRRTYRRRDLVAESDAATAAPAPTPETQPKPTRTYTRRDQTAEE